MMNEAVLNQYQKAPRTWIVNLIVVLILVTLVAWSGTTIELSKIPENGAEISKNIIKGIFSPDTTLLFDTTNKGVAYLLLETICRNISWFNFSNPICFLISYEYRSKTCSACFPYSNHGDSYSSNVDLRINVYSCNRSWCLHRFINHVCSINRDDF